MDIHSYKIPQLPLKIELEDKEVLKQVARSVQQLSELKGIVHTIPNESILINTLTLQEAKDSSEVENIVTTNDDLYRYELRVAEFEKSPASKEVLKYREAIQVGYAAVRENRILSNNIIQMIQSVLVGNKAGFRKVPGTELKDGYGRVVYQPPQDGNDVVHYMDNLESFINRPELSDLEPLVKLAVIHHQFESIHPFYDGNGRTGRIICILFLVLNQLLEIPVLYLSRYITQNKNEYYQLIQAVRDRDGALEDWKRWILFLLRGIEITAKHTISIVGGIRDLMARYKDVLRPAFGKVYRHELINHLFMQPYTKIEHMMRAMNVSRITATKYLERIVGLGLLEKVKLGKSNYYVNIKLAELLVNHVEIDR